MDDIPEAYICPITQAIMQDPYIDSDGNSYEKDAIYNWVRSNPISPITRNSLSVQHLVPNRVLKDIIEAFRIERGEVIAGAKGSESKAEDSKADAKGSKETESEAKDLDRKPLMLFTLIDTSGSMGSPCGNNADGESDGYNRLDLVKHTLNTIITSLTSQDKICVIKFSTVAEIFANLSPCNDNNKTMLIERIKLIKPEGQTNIWDALRMTIDVIASQGNRDEYNIATYLLTDGEPNINPPGTITDTLSSYMRTKLGAGNRPKVSTFGYGYSLDSNLLYGLSSMNNGVFGFIPDSTMVGTVFINALSNTLVNSHQTSCDSKPQAKGEEEPTESQSKGFAADEAAASKEETPYSTEFQDIHAKTVQMFDRLLATRPRDLPDPTIISDFLAWIKQQQNELRNIEFNDRKVLDFIDDLELDCDADTDDANLGQIGKASLPEYWKKWGKHYILSAASAFKMRMCSNFKDKAMQHFKNSRFTEEQQRVEDVFIQLPPPKPSIGQYDYGYSYRGGGGSSAPVISAPTSMTSYYNQSGGCFSSDSLVVVLDDGNDINSKRTLVPACNLKKGMHVLSAMPVQTDNGAQINFSVDRVECLVKMRYTGLLYKVGAMSLTAYHPVLFNAMPQFPVECNNEAIGTHTDSWVYDVVLKNRGLLVSHLTSGTIDQTIQVPMLVATFGHTCKLPKFKHNYFGAEAVVQDLQRHSGYQMGFLELMAPQFKRDPRSQEVVRLELGGNSNLINQ